MLFRARRHINLHSALAASLLGFLPLIVDLSKDKKAAGTGGES
jgi:hypothetical protein